MSLSGHALLLYSIILLLVGAAVGSWFTRLLLRYPFGRNPLTGKDSMVGKTARVVSKKGNMLRVFINSQVWNAETMDMDIIEKGDKVLITEVDNLTLKVVSVKKDMNEAAAST